MCVQTNSTGYLTALNLGLVQPSTTALAAPSDAIAEGGSSADAMALDAACAFSIGAYEAAQCVQTIWRPS